ncbi:acyl carrier protein [Gordonia sp. CNJ-863]|uniref:acyl carrier protein n=1 Tax=Gordonia sp. CNJ-863 TaxID=1904963 RepID=UPI0021CB598B|nr:acyl carrier protein [Gordonia sp. CNJ-863]
MPPADEAERLVAAAFADVLGAEEISVAGSFFDLGGNSLSATRLAARVGEAMDAEVSVRMVFERRQCAIWWPGSVPGAELSNRSSRGRGPTGSPCRSHSSASGSSTVSTPLLPHTISPRLCDSAAIST